MADATWRDARRLSRAFPLLLTCTSLAACSDGGGAKGSEDEDTTTECAADEWQTREPTSIGDSACAPLSVCPPGQYVSAQATANSDRSCSACPSGTFSEGENAAACTPWTACEPGEYVSQAGSASRDQRCTPCSEGTYSDGQNRAACVPRNACAPGTVQTTPGSASAPPRCEPCSAGSHCAGGEAPAVPCADGTWDHDADPATACVAWTGCVPGQYVLAEGDALSDRVCSPCDDGSYSDTQNAPSCAPWTTCTAGEYVSTGPSTSNDRVCKPEWIRQFGSADADHADSVSVDADGSVLVAGYTYGSLPDQASAGGQDAFVRKYNRDGELQWTHQFGSATSDRAYSVSADADQNVLVAGGVGGTLPEQTSAGGPDAFVRKYDRNGNLLWTRQFGSDGSDYATAVSVDADQNVLLAGYTGGSLSGQSSAGGIDAFVAKYDPAGNLLWTRQFGSASADYANSVSVDPDQNVLVAGQTQGTLPEQTSTGSQDAFVRKYDRDGNLLWTRQFGTAALDIATSVSVDADQNVLVAGETQGTLPEQTSAGSQDAFVRKYDRNGNLLWTRQFGSASSNWCYSVSVDANHNVLVAGGTLGTLPGQTSAGAEDAFVRKYDRNGDLVWTRQFGSGSYDIASSVSVDKHQNVLIAGQSVGTLPGQSSAGSADAFVAKFASP